LHCRNWMLCWSRNDKRPALSDLRESGAIEQDADVVVFVHRPKCLVLQNKTMNQQKACRIIIGKQRNGPNRYRKLQFIKNYARFESRTVFVLKHTCRKRRRKQRRSKFRIKNCNCELMLILNKRYRLLITDHRELVYYESPRISSIDSYSCIVSNFFNNRRKVTHEISVDPNELICRIIQSRRFDEVAW